ncbi:unnamed protein product [Zymoseptoria tritici ST99CH_1A5]|uniref:Uncharacterized protein n=1 Tax=Zymoseptoria tritici ST99CH_1A5 TaxID=1276529 RepID=A0A1Y6LQG7_ZYMTR|nr:unnamed protein product [Zymoseptoria tritici ST99CH_3D1]SMY25700.1 unnamed protein product [Zymoseptoria tritici ST99CH_1A5]
MDTCREQILANLKVIRPSLTRTGNDLEIVTARASFGGVYYNAWVFSWSEPPLPILKGPNSTSSKKAVEALLEMTADLVALGCKDAIKDFEAQLSHQVGDGGLVLETAFAEPELELK